TSLLLVFELSSSVGVRREGDDGGRRVVGRGAGEPFQAPGFVEEQADRVARHPAGRTGVTELEAAAVAAEGTDDEGGGVSHAGAHPGRQIRPEVGDHRDEVLATGRHEAHSGGPGAHRPAVVDDGHAADGGTGRLDLVPDGEPALGRGPYVAAVVRAAANEAQVA